MKHFLFFLPNRRLSKCLFLSPSRGFYEIEVGLIKKRKSAELLWKQILRTSRALDVSSSFFYENKHLSFVWTPSRLRQIHNELLKLTEGRGVRKVGDILPHKTQEWYKISALAGTIGVSGPAQTIEVSRSLRPARNSCLQPLSEYLLLIAIIPVLFRRYIIIAVLQFQKLKYLPPYLAWVKYSGWIMSDYLIISLIRWHW